MLVLGHLGVDTRAWDDPFQAAGLVYPDIFAVCPQVHYRVSHYLAPTSTKRLVGGLRSTSTVVRQFAGAMLRHVRDDRRLPLMATACRPWALPLAARARAMLTLPVLANQTEAVELILLPEIVAAVLELLLSQRQTENVWKRAMLWSGTVNHPEIILFIADQWQLEPAVVRNMNARWRETFSPFVNADPMEFVVMEMQEFWPSVAAIQLFEAGLLTNMRECVLTRRILQDNIEALLPAMASVAETLDFARTTDLLIGAPHPAFSYLSVGPT